MFYTLGLKDLPFEQDVHQIIYVEGEYNEDINRLIEENYQNIRDCFESKGYEFCYIPKLKHDLCRNEVLRYTAPYAKEANADGLDDDNFVLQYMLYPKNKSKIPPSLLYYHPSCKDKGYTEAKFQYRGMSISALSFDQDKSLKSSLLKILSDIDRFDRKYEDIRFRVEVGDTVSETLTNGDRDDGIRFSIGENDTPSDPLTADERFDTESKALVREIKDRVNRLTQKGISAYIVKNLIFGEKERLSKLLITKDYHIFLPDYDNMEIQMTPLPKAVFLFFLNHPEGVMFSYLPDYREELLDIYRKVKGPFFNLSSAKKTIEDVTDPLKNSINENCSRIREAFVSQFDEHLARFYYVDGQRGEEKKIALPRELVKI